MSVMENQKKPSLAQWWADRMANSSLTPEQQKEATVALLYLLRARRASREAWAAIDKAMRQPLP